MVGLASPYPLHTAPAEAQRDPRGGQTPRPSPRQQRTLELQAS